MILYFNPGHETAVHNASPYYMPPANVAAMQRELAFLPAWYAQAGDVVFADEGFNGIYNLFPGLPETISEDGIEKHKGAEVSLWGVSPQAIYYFRELGDKYQVGLKLPQWHEDYKYLNSRQAARDVLMEVAGEVAEISQNIIPRFYTIPEEIEGYVTLSSDRLLAKAPYSSSGRGLLWLPPSGITRTERQILHGILKKQGCVSVERVLDKQMDFAMEFLCDGKGGVEFAGYSLFYTNSKGAYHSNYVGAQEKIGQQIAEKIPQSLLEQVKSVLLKSLQDKYAGLYKGCVGVDMMIYKEGDEYKLHPCVEINMRYNMGYLALKLFENYILPSSRGRFYIEFSAKEEESYNKHLQMQKDYPVHIVDGRLASGYLSLCPVDKQSRYRAYVVVE